MGTTLSLILLIIFIITTSSLRLVESEKRRIKKFNWYDEKLKIITNKKGMVHKGLMQGYKDNYC